MLLSIQNIFPNIVNAKIGLVTVQGGLWPVVINYGPQQQFRL